MNLYKYIHLFIYLPKISLFFSLLQNLTPLVFLITVLPPLSPIFLSSPFFFPPSPNARQFQPAMGKASRWFRNLLGLKQPNPSPNPNPKHNPKPPKEKRRWSFVKSYREKSPAFNPNPNPNPKAVCQSHQPCYTNYNADTSSSSYVDGGEDANKHAIAVAAATAAVAEAAVAAAQAAAAVVRLTNSGRCDDTDNGNSNFDNNHNNNNNCVTQAHVNRGEKELSVAAVVIQSHFRGYLARRALRALKGLVKLQALVRGHIMRRKTSETMRCMQAMVRAQARARLVRAHIPESPFSSTKSCPIILHPGPPTPEKFEQFAHAEIMKHDQLPKIKRNSSRSSSRINAMNQQEVPNFGSSWSDPRNTMWDPKDTSSTTRTCHTDDDRADRILEIDTGKPHHQTTFRRRSLFEPDQMSHSRTTSKDSATHHTIPSPPSCEVVQTLKNLVLPQEMIDDGNSYCTAENSPQYCSAASQGGSSSRRVGPFTPTKSDGSRSFLSGYSDCPSYMSYTESSKAKMRSASAPKQRPQYERTTSNKRYSIHGFGEHHPRSNAQRSAAMHASFTSKAYPGSGRLDRLGMPVRDSTVVYYSGYLN